MKGVDDYESFELTNTSNHALGSGGISETQMRLMWTHRGRLPCSAIGTELCRTQDSRFIMGMEGEGRTPPCWAITMIAYWKQEGHLMMHVH